MTRHAGRSFESICTIDDLRGPCWHLRRASGRPYGLGQEQKVWVASLGRAMRPTTAAFVLAFPDRKVQRGRRVYRGCCSHDCVNPGHLRVGSYRHAAAAAGRRGSWSTPGRLALNEQLSARWRADHWTEETKQWAIESPQNHAGAAWGLMVHRSTVAKVRQQARHRREQLREAAAWSSIFRVGTAAANPDRKAA